MKYPKTVKDALVIWAGVMVFFFVLLPTIGGWLYELCM